MNPDVRLYGSAIALVSGVYSIVSGLARPMGPMPTNESIMLVVGGLVLLHGVALLTPVAERLGRASGPLMVLSAALMLGNQALAALSSTSMMSGGSMSWDGGMVAIAVLMLASGLIMIRPGRMP